MLNKTCGSQHFNLVALHLIHSNVTMYLRRSSVFYLNQLAVGFVRKMHIKDFLHAFNKLHLINKLLGNLNNLIE